MDFQINQRFLPFPNNINVNSQKIVGQLVVAWDRVKNPDEGDPAGEIVSVGYNIYRGASVAGIFYKLNNAIITDTKYIDNQVSLNPNTQYFYKISTVAIYQDKSQIEGPLSPPVIFEIPTTNKWFKKVNERNMWILKNTGVLMDLYVRKTEGPRCPYCYDDIRGQAGDENCLHCFGTSYEGGYEPMFKIYVRQKPASSQLDLIPMGYAPNSSPGAWTISTVMIKNRDILINPYGTIYSITGSTLSHAAGYFFHQELTMKELDHTDMKYNIPRKILYPNI